MSSLAIKLTSLAIRTLAKPIAYQIKQQAHEHARFRQFCINLAQTIHRADMRIRLSLLRETSTTQKAELAAEQAKTKAATSPSSSTPSTTTPTKDSAGASAKGGGSKPAESTPLASTSRETVSKPAKSQSAEPPTARDGGVSAAAPRDASKDSSSAQQQQPSKSGSLESAAAGNAEGSTSVSGSPAHVHTHSHSHSHTHAHSTSSSSSSPSSSSSSSSSAKKKSSVSTAPHIRPLSDVKALERGANFISEAFLFSVAGGLILFETVRSRLKESARRDMVQERLQQLEEVDEIWRKKVEILERRLDQAGIKAVPELADGSSNQPPKRIWDESGGWFGRKWKQAKEATPTPAATTVASPVETGASAGKTTTKAIDQPKGSPAPREQTGK